MAENMITDIEKIALLKRYILVADDFLRQEFTDKLNTFIKCPSYDAEVVLELYCAKINAVAFEEFCRDLNKILYLL